MFLFWVRKFKNEISINKLYSEVLKNNVENLKRDDIKFINPFLPFDKKNLVKKVLELDEFKEQLFQYLSFSIEVFQLHVVFTAVHQGALGNHAANVCSDDG